MLLSANNGFHGSVNHRLSNRPMRIYSLVSGDAPRDLTLHRAQVIYLSLWN